MASELLTTWGDYQSALDRVLAEAQSMLRIFDPDLSLLKLEEPGRLATLQQLLKTSRRNQIQIALQNADHFRQRCPHLQELLRLHSDQFHIIEISDSLAHLRDTMVLAEESSGLIRFDIGQPRSKLVLSEPVAITPYLQRFAEIWREGGTPVSATTLGL